MNEVHSMVRSSRPAFLLLSVLSVRESMLSSGDSWMLIPTEETLTAMRALQVHNFTVPISKRKSFLSVSCLSLYNASSNMVTGICGRSIGVPICPSLHKPRDLRPGQAPRQLSAPFPRVTCSANPFFVTFHSLQRDHVESGSHLWYHAFLGLKVQWLRNDIPENFLLSCYPETLFTESDDGSESDSDPVKSGEESIVTPIHESPSLVTDKEVLVHEWVQQKSHRSREHFVPSNILPRTPQGDRTRRLCWENVRAIPQWHLESKRGRLYANLESKGEVNKEDIFMF
ncbi:hypothetical protein C8R45DRAFT_99215 [Mycena sanguinolenta]|nr:hypothetical protein C8R45DRAFT_99215 [Mycena sanguinolenta]